MGPALLRYSELRTRVPVAHNSPVGSQGIDGQVELVRMFGLRVDLHPGDIGDLDTDAKDRMSRRQLRVRTG